MPESVEERLVASFGSVDKFKETFEAVAASAFGSAWVWLVEDEDGDLNVQVTSNAGVPFTNGQHALLVLDVWEHAYYLKYQNRRPDFISSFWPVVNWDFVDERLKT